jgi:hypothetical protein
LTFLECYLKCIDSVNPHRMSSNPHPDMCESLHFANQRTKSCCGWQIQFIPRITHYSPWNAFFDGLALYKVFHPDMSISISAE